MELLEIEKDLAGADGKAALARYDEMLVSLGTRVKTALNRGLEPDEFAKCTALAEVVTLARKLLRLQVQKKDFV